jgi:transposase
MNKQNCREHCHWVGVDVAKNSFDAGLVLSDQHFPETQLRDIPARTFKRTAEGVGRFLAWLDEKRPVGDEVRVVMEATGSFSTELAMLLLERRLSLAPAIANPYQTSMFIKSMCVRNKTDRMDARALGFYGVERQPVAYEPPTPERAELRELSRFRDSLVKQQTMMKNQAKELFVSSLVAKLHSKRLRLIEADIKRVEHGMKELVAEHDELKRDVELLSSINGIAFLSACMIIAELGDLRRFGRARQLTAFAGMSPRYFQSGTSINGKAHLCKSGSPRVRQGLYLSAMVAIRDDTQFRKIYRNLVQDGKPPMVALGAIMRKLLVVMRIILIRNEPFKPVGITH